MGTVDLQTWWMAEGIELVPLTSKHGGLGARLCERAKEGVWEGDGRADGSMGALEHGSG